MAQQAGSPFGSTIDFGGAVASDRIGWDVGTRQISMHEELINLSPTATVTMSTLGEVDIESATPEWLQVTLKDINQTNAVAEGADYTYEDENLPVIQPEIKEDVCQPIDGLPVNLVEHGLETVDIRPRVFVHVIRHVHLLPDPSSVC